MRKHPPPEGDTSDRRAKIPQIVGMKQRQRRTTRDGKGKEIPQGGHRYRYSMWGGVLPPRRKTQTYKTLPRYVHTCCCKEFMDTSAS